MNPIPLKKVSAKLYTCCERRAGRNPCLFEPITKNKAKPPQRSSPRKRGSSLFKEKWIPAFKKCYRYKGRLLLEEERTSEQATFRWFHPSGKLRDEIIYPLASKPKVTVSAFPDKETYLVSVYNRPLRMEVHGPVNHPPAGDLTKSLTCVGEILQKIPESMIVPMLTGDRAESPLILRTSTSEYAKQSKWSGENEPWAGKYFGGKNILWSNIADSCLQFDPTLSERSYQARKHASSYSYLLED